MTIYGTPDGDTSALGVAPSTFLLLPGVSQVVEYSTREEAEEQAQRLVDDNPSRVVYLLQIVAAISEPS